MGNDPVILMVDDNEDDVFMLRWAFKKLGVVGRIEVARDGEQAVRYLSGEEAYADRQRHPLPGLVLLDVKMPLLDGFQVLQWIRREPGLAGLPVLIVTSSDWPLDIERAYSLRANSYLVKQVGLENFQELAGVVKDYWLDRSRLPVLAG